MPLTGRSTGVQSSSAQPSRPDIPGVISTSSWPQSELAAGGFFLRERHLLHAINTAKKQQNWKSRDFFGTKHVASAVGKCVWSCKGPQPFLILDWNVLSLPNENIPKISWRYFYHGDSAQSKRVASGLLTTDTKPSGFILVYWQFIFLDWHSGGRLWGGPLMIHPQSSPPADRVA